MTKEALAHLRVVDFSWGLTGPLVGKYLADHGATIVKIESNTRVDATRTTAPYKDGKPGVDRSAYFAFYQANKHSISINMNSLRGIEVAKRLIAWSDVVLESFSPGQMERWGLGYEDLKKVKPDIIMVRTSSQGETGPHSGFSAFGLVLTGLTTIPQFVGWPDRDPLIVPMAYSDIVSPRFIVAALLAAVNYRRRTGRGQCIDIAQSESTLHFVSPAILNYTVNGVEPEERAGNSSPCAAPHGAYRCKGDDRWCALAVFTDGQWKAFCNVLGNPKWTGDARFSTLLSRKANETELNRLIEAWTADYSPEQVMEKMQAAKVPAGIVKNGRDMYEDPQFKHRHCFWRQEHEVIGQFTYCGESFELSETPAKYRSPAPLLGQHTEYVCTEILGMSDEEFIELLSLGTFE